MDPITIATVIVEIAKIGLKIKETCEKVSSNRRELSALSKDLLDDLQNLDLLCHQHADLLQGDQAPLQYKAMIELKGKFQSVYEVCEKSLVVQTKGWLRIGQKFKSFFTVAEVEDKIKTLKEELDCCHRSFQTFCAARTELKADQIQGDTKDLKAGMTELLRITHEIHAGLPDMKATVQHQLDVLVTASSQQPTLPTPFRAQTLDQITYHVDKLPSELEKLTATDDAIVLQQPIPPFVYKFTGCITFRRSPTQRRRSLLMETLRILDSLENADNTFQLALSLMRLGERFSGFQMRREASVFYTWAAKLYRILGQRYETEIAPYLAEALANTGGDSATGEAVALLRALPSAQLSTDVQCQLACSLRRQAGFLSGIQGLEENAFRLINEALGILEHLLQDNLVFLELFGSSSQVRQDEELAQRLLTSDSQGHAQWGATYASSVNGPRDDFELIGDESRLWGYVLAAGVASLLAFRLGRPTEGATFRLKAAHISRYFTSIYPNTDLERFYAWDLTEIAIYTRAGGKKAEALRYVQLAVDICWKAYKYDAEMFTSILLSAMAHKVDVLGDMGLDDEARNTLDELRLIEFDEKIIRHPLIVANTLSHASIQYQALQQNDSAIILQTRVVRIYRIIHKKPSRGEASAYSELAAIFYVQGRKDEAAKASHTALQQFQHLVIESPSQLKDTQPIIHALIVRISTFSSDPSLHQHVLEETKTLFDHFMSIVQNDVQLLEYYHGILTSVITAIPFANIAIAMSLYTVKRLETFALTFPSAAGERLLSHLLAHGLLLHGLGHSEEATVWLTQALEKYNNLTTSDEIRLWSVYMATYLARVLKARGKLQEARKVIKDTINAVGALEKQEADIAAATIFAMSVEMEIVKYLESARAAMQSAEMALSYRRLCDIDDEPLVMHHLQHSRTLTTHGEHQQALSLARQALKTIRAEMCSDGTIFDGDIYYWPSEYMRTMASCLADGGELSEALGLAREAVEEAARVEEAVAMFLDTAAEGFHGSALWTQGCIQLFSGDREGCVKPLEDALAIWEKRDIERIYDKRELALALWALGIVHCLAGRHDKCASSHMELQTIIDGFKYTHPIMHRVVVATLEHERRRPAWVRFLKNVKNELGCEHLIMISVE